MISSIFPHSVPHFAVASLIFPNFFFIFFLILVFRVGEGSALATPLDCRQRLFSTNRGETDLMTSTSFLYTRGSKFTTRFSSVFKVTIHTWKAVQCTKRQWYIIVVIPFIFLMVSNYAEKCVVYSPLPHYKNSSFYILTFSVTFAY